MMNAKYIRPVIYGAGILAGLIAMAGYGEFDSKTNLFDLYPFNVKDAVLTLASMAGNAVAALAFWRGWKGKGGARGDRGVSR